MPRIRDRLHLEDFFSIPNILSYIRIIMVPFIVVIYAIDENYLLATALIFVSGRTDVADGFIARKFNMSLNKLSGLNPDIKNINLIHVGDKIRVK